MGTKWPKPVRVANKMVVLIGVLVTHALIAAMQLTIAKVRFIDGNRLWRIRPRVVPTKKSGIINPPRQPDVTVTAIAMILNRRTAKRN